MSQASTLVRLYHFIVIVYYDTVLAYHTKLSYYRFEPIFLWSDQYHESYLKGSLWCEVYHILGSCIRYMQSWDPFGGHKLIPGDISFMPFYILSKQQAFAEEVE